MRRRVIYSIVIALVVSSIVFLDIGEQLKSFERKTLDARYRFYASSSPYTKDILILNISEESIKRFEPIYGRWPWPRSIHGEITEYLRSDGASAIGFDIIFAERSLRQEMDSKTLHELRALAKNADMRDIRKELVQRLDSLRPELSDTFFVSKVKESGNVFLSSVFYIGENDLAADSHLESDEDATKKIKFALSNSALPITRKHRQNIFFNATIPFTELEEASRGTGHINFTPDSDGTCRRFVPLVWFKDNDTAYPSLSLIIAAHIKGIPIHQIGLQNNRVIIGDAVIPLLPDGSAMINYQGGIVKKEGVGGERYESFYTYIPYDAVVASKDLIQAGEQPLLPKGTFRNKIVLITVAAAGLTDLRATPFSPVNPGVEIHANIIDNILSKKFLHAMDGKDEKIYIILLSLIVGIITVLTNPYIGFAMITALVGSVIGFHWGLFAHGWLLPIVNPFVTMVGTYLGVILLKYVSEEREKKYIRSAFGYYLAPQVLEEILRSPDRLKLGGERRFMTVLFSDLEGFTSLSEQLLPEEISATLNEYFSQMMNCIKKTHGTLDKFIGDAIMAEWNAPVSQEDHAARACETALLMIEELKALRKKWERKPPLNIRIGINTGEMVAGNLGAKEIFDYTVVGTEVNISARLEPLNKDFGTHIIVSESTCREAEKHDAGKFIFRLLARVVLKGRRVPLNVYELVGWRDTIGKEHMEAIEFYHQGLDLFFKAKFSEAKKEFQKAIERYPEDGPSKNYIRFCKFYEKNPPPSDWGGVYEQTSK
jgi:adenylate cyclase